MYAKKKVKGPPMLVRLLDFFVRLLFKPLPFKFGIPAKRKRTPKLGRRCVYCYQYVWVMNKRQRVCFAKPCRTRRRKELCVARINRVRIAKYEAAQIAVVPRPSELRRGVPVTEEQED